MLALMIVMGCGPGFSPDAAKEAVVAQVTPLNPTGRIGAELIGKSRWVQAPMFDRSCLQDNDLAFADTMAERPDGAKSIQRISPTWTAQHWLTADTTRGWCVDMGDGISAIVGEPAVADAGWMVKVTYSLANPSPWAKCLSQDWLERNVMVTADAAGQPVLADVELAMFPGDCPSPMPAATERESQARPSRKAPGAPSTTQVQAAFKALDDALWERDLAAALDATSCYNLETSPEDMYGSCAPADLLQVGPHPRGEQRIGDGTPWTEFVISELDDVGRITRDTAIPTIYHVNMKHKRTGADRSVGVEWAGQKWKVVGVIGAKGADLTSVRYVYDLHKRDKRDVFVKRLAGEEIDEKGNKLRPWLDDEEEE